MGGQVADERGASTWSLASRHGPDAPGAASWSRSWNCSVRGSPSRRATWRTGTHWATLLAAGPDDLPLRVVVHVAGVAGAASPESVTQKSWTTCGGQGQGARHLDELTAGLD